MLAKLKLQSETKQTEGKWDTSETKRNWNSEKTRWNLEKIKETKKNKGNLRETTAKETKRNRKSKKN